MCRSPRIFDEAFKGLSVVEASIAAGDTVVPDPRHILEALRYFDPADARAVVIAQECRLRSEDLCFFCDPLVRIEQPSMDAIGRAIATDLQADPAKVPPLHDLRFWAAQGVLMLNRSLTSALGQMIQGKAEAHTEWTNFTDMLIGMLCELLQSRGQSVPFLLWGSSARELADLVKRHGHVALEWTHPSPLYNNTLPAEIQFHNCGHFLKTNQIKWADQGTFIACDGSCSKNGKPGATAGFGVTAIAGPLTGMEIAGSVEPFVYVWVDSTDPLRGIRPGSLPAAPSNIRGEYLAMCFALLAVCRAGLTSPVEIVTDSETLYKTILEWLPGWKAKGIVDSKKNPDLVRIIDTLYALAWRSATVRIVHVNSHQPKPEPRTSNERYLVDLWRWHANAEADRLAKAGNKSGRNWISSPFWIPGIKWQ